MAQIVIHPCLLAGELVAETETIMWKKLSTKTILDHPRLKVVEDEVELPNGEKIDYLRFDQTGSAPTVITINKENRFLVIKEYFYVTNE